MKFDFQYLRSIEKKWNKIWEDKKIFEADPDKNKKKFFGTVAYPYTSGSLHIGHGRTYTIADIFFRYKRMRGFNVLWPMAFHITGVPVIGISKKIEENDKETISLFKEYVGLYIKDKEEVERIVKSFVDPWNVVRFFSKVISNDFKALGFSIDWRRQFTTGDEEYKKFIEWQFQKLMEKGYIIRGSYPILFCPKCDGAVGEDDIVGGDVNKPKIANYVLIKFRDGEEFFVAGTMRPETIFGVTNLWINPSGDYVRVRVDDEIWIVSEKCVEKLMLQGKRTSVLEKIKGSALVGRKAEAPLTKKEVLILPADFVDTSEATGVVYSVPAHAPWDLIALEDLKKNKEYLKKLGILEEVRKIEPVSIAYVEKYKDLPAAEECERQGVKSLKDEEGIKKATEVLYKAEFYTGVLKENCNGYANLPMKEAKEKIFVDLKGMGLGGEFYEVESEEKPVKCRCGSEVMVAILPDQWFINYGDKKWKELAKECFSMMKIFPENYRKLFSDTIEWLHERPCARKRGIGTELPWDKKYIIESLSDSTIYMALYTIMHHIRKNKIGAEKLTYEFWDYVFSGNKDLESVAKNLEIDPKLLETLRKEFVYWYPNEHRHTAIGHITNHLTFFIFNHVAIFPKEHWPKIITLNNYVISRGEKMSKSKGNVVPLVEISEKYSADVYRLYVSSVADLSSVVDWREENVSKVMKKLEKFFEKVCEVKKEGSDKEWREKFNKIDLWLISSINKRIEEVTGLIERFEIQKYVQKAFFDTYNDLKYYSWRAGKINREVMAYFANIWVRLLAPVIPHICEELWSILGNKSLVSVEKWPEVEKNKIDTRILVLEETFKNFIEDLRNIMRMTGKKDSLYIYLADEDEFGYFSESINFLKSRFGFKSVNIYGAKDENRYDPANKAQRAKIGRPAIYLN